MEPVTQLGRYRLGEQIGSGGMADVFRAEFSGAEGFSRRVAIKRVRAKLVGDSDTASDFINEARLAQRLQHGNVVQIYDLGIEAGVPYIVMEFVDGLSLAEVIEKNLEWDHRLGIATSLFVIEAVADALDYAHRLSDADGNSDGVVHRDVNPRNILLSADGIVKLTDFGIAKGMNVRPRTLPGRVKGTLGYLSPEQAYGAIIGPPTDQFAAGVVLYQLLAGHNPLARAATIKEYRQMLDVGLPPLEGPDVDEELRAIVSRATASKVGARFASMSEFRQVLEAWRVARGVRTSLDGVRDIVRTYRGNKAPKRPASARLDDALLAQLGSVEPLPRATRSLEEVATTNDQRRKRQARPALTLAIAGIVAAVSVAAIAIGMRAGDDAPAERVAKGAAGAADDAATSVIGELVSIDEPEPIANDAGAASEQRPDGGLELTASVAPADSRDAERRTREEREERAKARAERERLAEVAAREAREERERAEAAAAVSFGTLRINVLPYAEVSVDGKSRGRTPKTLKVPAGTRKIRLHNPETGKTTTKTITVGDGETKSITSW